MPLNPNDLPSTETLLSVFSYEPNDGLLLWRQRDPSTRGAKIFNARWAGKEAGHLHSNGYITISLCGKTYYAHRIVWKMMTGEDVPEWIDHKDGNGANNKWDNLRSVSHMQNMWNSARFRNNTSGFRGVSFIKAHGKYRAAISVNGKKKHIGYFDTAEEAHLSVSDAIYKTRVEFARVA